MGAERSVAGNVTRSGAGGGRITPGGHRAFPARGGAAGPRRQRCGGASQVSAASASTWLARCTAPIGVIAEAAGHERL